MGYPEQAVLEVFLHGIMWNELLDCDFRMLIKHMMQAMLETAPRSMRRVPNGKINLYDLKSYMDVIPYWCLYKLFPFSWGSGP